MDIEEQRKALQSQLDANNINSVSFLATDFLNHYNEVFMMLEMVPDMPEIIEDLGEWQPKTYIQHFQDSSLAEKDVAIEAYELCPDHFKLPFDLLTTRLDQLIVTTINEAKTAYNDKDETLLNRISSDGLLQMKRLWSGLNAIIHSENTTEDQTSIDELLEKF